MKDEINHKREELHNIMLSKDVTNEEILKISQELDKLILKYYKMKNDKKN